MSYRRSRKLPKESRRIPLKGDKYRGNGEDHGRYYRCWNCGFVCDSDRDALGDGNSGNGVTHIDYVINAQGGSGDPLTSLATLDGDVNHYHVALEIGSDGEPKVIRHDYQTVINSGCPFCGSLNWRGDY